MKPKCFVISVFYWLHLLDGFRKYLKSSLDNLTLLKRKIVCINFNLISKHTHDFFLLFTGKKYDGCNIMDTVPVK